MFIQAEKAFINLDNVVEILPPVEERTTYEDSVGTVLVFNVGGIQCNFIKPNEEAYMLTVMTNGSKHLVLVKAIEAIIKL